MGEIPKRFPLLSWIARHEPAPTAHLGYMAALAATLGISKRLARYGASILYRTLGPGLPENGAAAAFLLPLALAYAAGNPAAVRRAGHRGNRLTLGSALFRAIFEKRSGLTFSVHCYEDVWSLLKTKDGRIHLEVPEMLEAWQALPNETPPQDGYRFIFTLGERRAYNANQIYRDSAWRKVDQDGRLRMHPEDAGELALTQDAKVICETEYGQIEAILEMDERMQRGVISLPHGYGMRFRNDDVIGPEINRLTSRAWCDPLARTPFHKFVPGNVRQA